MIRSLFSSASGLRGHQQLLDVVGNNLANANTTGFKAQRLRFANQFIEVLRAAGAPTADLGGTNPLQIGQGVQVAAIDTVQLQGTLDVTDIPLDLAIQNDGFFIVDNGLETVFTRDGAFSVDANNILVNSATGARVQRVGLVGQGTATAPAFQTGGTQNISIPFGTTIAGRASTQVVFTGNLDSDDAAPLAAVLTTAQPFTVSNGVAATTASQFLLLDQTTTAYVQNDEILITGTTVTGAAVNATFRFASVGATETLGDLVNTITAAFGGGSQNGATATIDGNGNIVLTADNAGVSQLSLSLASNPATTGRTTFSGLQSTVTGQAGAIESTAIVVFDDQGAAHTLTFNFQKQAANEWDLISVIDPTGTFVGFDDSVDGITFNENGSFRSVVAADSQEVLATSLPLTFTPAPAVGALGTQVAVAGTAISALDQSTGTFAGGDTIVVNATRADGTAVNTTIALDATTTVGDLITGLNAAAIFDSANATSGATATLVNGNLVVTANSSGPASLSLSLSTIAAAAGAQTTFDAFRTITEGSDGDANITFEINNLAGFQTTQNITFSLGTANGFDGLTQFGGFTNAAATEQDGFAPGSLVDVAVQGNGIINGIFDNGQVFELAQLAIATFRNPGGLERLQENFFRVSANSGVALIGTAQTGGAGSIQGGTLENSNVDIALEFTRLITAQRGFQINARAFTTSDEVLQEIANLKR